MQFCFRNLHTDVLNDTACCFKLNNETLFQAMKPFLSSTKRQLVQEFKGMQLLEDDVFYNVLLSQRVVGFKILITSEVSFEVPVNAII